MFLNANYDVLYSSIHLGRNMANEYCDIEIDSVYRVTDGAVLFSMDGQDVWIPKSVIEDVDLVIEPPWGSPQTIAIKRWFCKKENIDAIDE
jgi:hypothetical protein